MVLHFITGNRGKLKEVKEIIPEVEQIDLDLLEIQELDSRKIIEEKLKEAIKQKKGEFFCEDTSVYINSLNGLPGPLIKWFLKTIGDRGIWELVRDRKDKSARAVTCIGYTDGKEIRFFEGEILGEISEPRGEGGFGWDKIFKPKGSERTFGEMNLEEKSRISMRKIALVKLKKYLDSKQ
jgi:non-canonical purine NTP pyrophosphatase (RdgB/HAM1 family)